MGLVLARHNDAAKEWGTLSARTLNPSCISYEPKINSRTVQGDSNRAGAQIVTGGQEGQGSQGGQGATGQETVPDDPRADVFVHGFGNWVTSALFDMWIFNLDAGSNLRQTSEKALETAEKENNDKYVHPCPERRHSFTTILYSADGISETESVAAHQRLALLLSNNLKQEFSEMRGFVRARISLAIVISSTLLLQGAREKEACIFQRPDLEYGAVMSLLMPWRG